MDDPKLAADEARRDRQHEAVKSAIESEVHDEVTVRARQRDAESVAGIDRAASELREDAVKEVVSTERQVERSRSVARVSQVVDYVFWLVYVLLGLRFLLSMIAARNVGFVQFIRSVTEPLYAPFRGIVASPEAPGGYTFEWPLLIALLVYALLHLTINRALRALASRKTTI
jgi:uncharacterized protein YggT (Ycf19 family)